MFNTTKLYLGLKNLIGWEQHYATTELQISPTLLASESGHKFQSYHPALRLDIIQASLPDNRDINEYLETITKNAVSQLANDIIVRRGYEQYASKTLANDIILDKVGYINDTVPNTGRFCGFIIKTKLSIGLRNVIKAIGFQQTAQQQLDIYVYHTSKRYPVTKLSINTTGSGNFSWTPSNYELTAEDGDLIGGHWIVGYYQDDLEGNAIQYKNFDWNVGPCLSCDGGQRAESFRNLKKYMEIHPFYVAGGNLPAEEDVNGTMTKPLMDMEQAFYVSDNNFGMNFRVSAECDLTEFIIDHRFAIVPALGYKVALLILHDILYSTETNYIEESMKGLIIRDLEGDKSTKSDRLQDKYFNAIEAVNYDHSAKSAFCLPCNKTQGVKYGVA